MEHTHVTAHIRLPRTLRLRLRVLAAERGTSLRRLAAEAFEALLDRYADRSVPAEQERRDG